MTVHVLFFSVLKDLTGVAETPWTLDESATLRDLLAELFRCWPALAEWDQSLLLAINQQYTSRDAVLPPGAEIAVMPPVQGG